MHKVKDKLENISNKNTYAPTSQLKSVIVECKKTIPMAKLTKNIKKKCANTNLSSDLK